MLTLRNYLITVFKAKATSIIPYSISTHFHTAFPNFISSEQMVSDQILPSHNYYQNYEFSQKLSGSLTLRVQNFSPRTGSLDRTTYVF